MNKLLFLINFVAVALLISLVWIIMMTLMLRKAMANE